MVSVDVQVDLRRASLDLLAPGTLGSIEGQRQVEEHFEERHNLTEASILVSEVVSEGMKVSLVLLGLCNLV